MRIAIKDEMKIEFCAEVIKHKEPKVCFPNLLLILPNNDVWSHKTHTCTPIVIFYIKQEYIVFFRIVLISQWSRMIYHTSCFPSLYVDGRQFALEEIEELLDWGDENASSQSEIAFLTPQVNTLRL